MRSILRAHPNNGDAGDPAEEEALRRRKDRLATLQREETMADQHLIYVQELLRGMSEDDHCKSYRRAPSPPLTDRFSLTKNFLRVAWLTSLMKMCVVLPVLVRTLCLP